MKTTWHILTTIILLALLALPGFKAVAEDADPVTGICWFLEEPESPDVREWFNGPDDLRYHLRNEIQLALCDFTDDRLDGYMELTVSWDVLLNPESIYWLTGHDHGAVVLTDADGNVTWEGRYNNFIDETSTIHGKLFVNGVGEYKNLRFEGTSTFSFVGDPDWAVHIEGAIK